jgi:hypothetical protein
MQTGRDLRLSGSVRQCQEPRFWLICPIAKVGNSRSLRRLGRILCEAALENIVI